MKRALYKIINAIIYLYERFFEEGFSYRSASLAYSTLLALVPLTIVSFTVLSYFPFFKGVGQRLQDLILANFVAASANVIAVYLKDFAGHIKYLSWFNITFLGVVCLLMIYNINQTFISVWKSEPRIHFTLSFLLYLVVLVVSPIVFAGVMLLSGYLLKLPYIDQFLKATYLQKFLLFSLPHVLVFITFTVINWVLPSCKVKLRHAALGGLITTILFESAKFGFASYLSHFSSYQLIYGALATIPIFLLWLYISWVIILLSALITNLVAKGIPKDKLTLH